MLATNAAPPAHRLRIITMEAAPAPANGPPSRHLTTARAMIRTIGPFPVRSLQSSYSASSAGPPIAHAAFPMCRNVMAREHQRQLFAFLLITPASVSPHRHAAHSPASGRGRSISPGWSPGTPGTPVAAARESNTPSPTRNGQGTCRAKYADRGPVLTPCRKLVALPQRLKQALASSAPPLDRSARDRRPRTGGRLSRWAARAKPPTARWAPSAGSTHRSPSGSLPFRRPPQPAAGPAPRWCPSRVRTTGRSMRRGARNTGTRRNLRWPCRRW